MSASSLTFDVIWNGEKRHVITKDSDVARVEAQFGKSFSKIAEDTPVGLFLSMAYYRLRADGVEVPGTYDEFLNGDPEIENIEGADGGKDDEGSTSETPAPSTGNS